MNDNRHFMLQSNSTKIDYICVSRKWLRYVNKWISYVIYIQFEWIHMYQMFNLQYLVLDLRVFGGDWWHWCWLISVVIRENWNVCFPWLLKCVLSSFKNLCIVKVTCSLSYIVYHALYLEHLTSRELLEKLAKLYNVGASQIGELYCQGPSGIYVLLNDEVLQNMSEQSRFCVEAMKCKLWCSVTLNLHMCILVFRLFIALLHTIMEPHLLCPTSKLWL